MARLSDYLGVSQSDFIWISCVKPQARGAYHIHLLIKHKNYHYHLITVNFSVYQFILLEILFCIFISGTGTFNILIFRIDIVD